MTYRDRVERLRGQLQRTLAGVGLVYVDKRDLRAALALIDEWERALRQHHTYISRDALALFGQGAGMTLTREQIEKWRNSPNDALNRSMNITQFRALCDMALRATESEAGQKAAELVAVKQEADPALASDPAAALEELREAAMNEGAQVPAMATSGTNAEAVDGNRPVQSGEAMTDTPRTDELFDQHVQENLHCAASERHGLAVQQVKELLNFARTLERELAAANEAGANLHAKWRETEAALIETKRKLAAEQYMTESVNMPALRAEQALVADLRTRLEAAEKLLAANAIMVFLVPCA